MQYVNNLKNFLIPFSAPTRPQNSARIEAIDDIFKPKPNIVNLSAFEVRPSIGLKNDNVHLLLDSFSNIADDSFFNGLIKGRDPLGLEIYGDKDRITFNLLFPRKDIPFLVSKTQSIYTGCNIKRVNKDSYMKNFSLLNKKNVDVTNIITKHHPFMPFATDERDVFTNIINTLELARNDEQVLIQILAQPADNAWQHKYMEAYNNFIETGKQPLYGFNPLLYIVYFLDFVFDFLKNIANDLLKFENDSKPPVLIGSTAINQAQLKQAVNKKIQGQGFRTSIRIAACTEDKNRRAYLSKLAAAAFSSMNNFNEIRLSYNKIFKSEAIINLRQRKCSIMDSQILSTNEIKNLYKLPTANIISNKLVRTDPTERLVDRRVVKKGIQIGITPEYQGNSYPVNFSASSALEINKSCVVIAPPGSGKSTMLENMAVQCMETGIGFCAIDIADGKMYKRTLGGIDPKYDNKLIALDFTSKDRPILLSPSAIAGDSEIKSMMFCEWFCQLLNIGKDMMRTISYLEKYCMSTFINPDNTLLEFKLLLEGNEAIRQSIIEYLAPRDKELYLWWTCEYPRFADQIDRELMPLRYRLDTLFLKKSLRNIFCGRGGTIKAETVRKWIDEGYGIVVNLNEGCFTVDEQRAIISLLNTIFWSAALGRYDLTNQNKEPRPFKMLLDEPHTYLAATEFVTTGITKLRKYGMSITMYFHDADQFIRESAELWKSILSSDPHMILGYCTQFTIDKIVDRLSPMTKQEALSLFNEISDITKHRFIANIYNNGKVPPFIFVPLPPFKELHNKQAVINRSIANYAPHRAEQIQDDINARRYNLSLLEGENELKKEPLQWAMG